MTKWTTGTITDITHWTESLFSITVQAAVEPFTAGQFVKLALEIDGKSIARAYSYVNAPNQDRLEFYLAKVADGKLSPHLQQLSVGSPISITTQATGFFVLNEIPSSETLWMIATGTGISPFLSMLQQQQQETDRFNQLVLIHAVRYAQDLNYLPLMQQLVEQYQGKLRIQTILSREHHPDSLHGRIPQLIEDRHLEKAVGLTIEPERSHIMLCGNPEMIAETRQLLQQQRNMQKHLRRKPGQITSENYW